MHLYDLTPQITKYVEREILNQLRMRHPHVVSLLEVFLTDEYLVLVRREARAALALSLMQNVYMEPAGGSSPSC